MQIKYSFMEEYHMSLVLKKYQNYFNLLINICILYLYNTSNKPKENWDHQMNFSVRMNNAVGIAPSVNQIRNIGVDERSTHGGTSLNNIMTKRFCGIQSYPLQFPLKHPRTVTVDPVFERKTEKIILMPFRKRLVNECVRIIKPFLGFGKYESVSWSTLKLKLTKK
jgi:hypothetical protein